MSDGLAKLSREDGKGPGSEEGKGKPSASMWARCQGEGPASGPRNKVSDWASLLFDGRGAKDQEGEGRDTPSPNIHI